MLKRHRAMLSLLARSCAHSTCMPGAGIVSRQQGAFMNMKSDHLDVDPDAACLTILGVFRAQSQTGLGLHSQLCQALCQVTCSKFSAQVQTDNAVVLAN